LAGAADQHVVRPRAVDTLEVIGTRAAEEDTRAAHAYTLKPITPSASVEAPAAEFVAPVAPVNATANRGHDVIASAGVNQGAQPRVDFYPVVAVEEAKAKTNLSGRDATQGAPQVNGVRRAARPGREWLTTPGGKVVPTVQCNP
jgi:hypothetical protein